MTRRPNPHPEAVPDRRQPAASAVQIEIGAALAAITPPPSPDLIRDRLEYNDTIFEPGGPLGHQSREVTSRLYDFDNRGRLIVAAGAVPHLFDHVQLRLFHLHPLRNMGADDAPLGSAAWPGPPNTLDESYPGIQPTTARKTGDLLTLTFGCVTKNVPAGRGDATKGGDACSRDYGAVGWLPLIWRRSGEDWA